MGLDKKTHIDGIQLLLQTVSLCYYLRSDKEITYR